MNPQLLLGILQVVVGTVGLLLLAREANRPMKGMNKSRASARGGFEMRNPQDYGLDDWPRDK